MAETSKSKVELLEEIAVLRRRIELLEAKDRHTSPATSKSDTNLRALFDNIADGILVADLDMSRFLRANKRMCDMLGYQQHEIRRLTVADIHPPDAMPRVSQHFKDQAPGKTNVITDIPVKRKDGSIFYADINAFTICFDGIECAAGVFRDITHQKDIDSQLQMSEAAMKAVLNATTESVLLLDLNKRIIGLNKICAKRLGESPAELVGRTIDSVLRNKMPSKAANNRLAKLDDVIRTGQPVTLEDKREQRSFGSSLFPVLDNAGNVSAIAIFARDITEQRKMIDQLKASEATMKAILDATTETVLLINADERVLATNKTATERLGMRAEDLIGMSIEQLLHETTPSETAELRIANCRRVCQSGKPIRMEDQRKGRTFDTNMYPVFDPSGNVTSVVIFACDITEHKNAQKALEDSEAWYRSMIELGTTVYTVLDADGTVRYISPTVKQAYGWEQKEIIGTDAFEFVHPEDTEYAKEKFANLLKNTGVAEEAEMRYRHKDGSWMTIAVLGVNLIDEPAVNGIVLTSHDITKRKELENAIIRSEQQYRTLVESAGETIAAIDSNGVFLFVNTTGAERLGVTPEDIIGKTMWDFFPKQIADHQVQSVRAVVNSGRGRTMRTLTNVKGEKRWYYTTIEPITEVDGTSQAVMIIARDVHDIELAQLELVELRQRMAKAEKLASMGTIAATLSHRVTQPLTAITLSIENALAEIETTKTPPSVSTSLKRGIEGASQIASIVDNLRTLARSSEEPVKESIRPELFVTEVLRLLEQTAQNARVSIEVSGLDQLPPCIGNRFELEQACFALVQNAIQAADRAAPHKVAISGSYNDKEIQLTFSDNCGGIDPKDADKIFEPFFTTKSFHKGTGLGLPIAEQIIKRTGGRIRLENTPTKGATFIVTIPRAEQETN